MSFFNHGLLAVVMCCHLGAQFPNIPKAPFSLHLSTGLRAAWELSPQLFRWQTFEGIELARDGEPASQKLMSQFNLASNTAWVLTDAQGHLIEYGIADLNWDRIQQALELRGWRSRESQRKNFLLDHPNQVETRLQEVQAHLAYVTLCCLVQKEGKQKGTDAALAKAMTDLEGAFSFLVRTPGWTYHLPSSFYVSWRTLALIPDVPFSDGFASIASQALADLELAILVEPSKRELWGLWTYLGQTTSQKLSPLELLQRLELFPGEPFPPPTSALPSYYIERRDWRGLLELGRWGWDRIQFNQSNPSLAGDPVMQKGALGWGQAIITALIYLEREGELLSSLAELRAASGPAWTGVAKHNQQLITLLKPNLLTSALKELLESPPLPQPKITMPLRYCLAFSPRSNLAGQRALAFEPWTMGELEFRELSTKEWERLMRINQWEPGGHWILLKGDQVIASGPTSGMEPLAISDRIREILPPRLELLGAYIRSHSESIDARKARLDLLRLRPPTPSVNIQILEDASALLVDPQVDHPNGISPSVLEGLSLKVLPRIEERLHASPSEGSLWSAYLAWSRWVPSGDRQVVQLAITIPILGDRRLWIKRLPKAVVTSIGGAFQRLGNKSRLESWNELITGMRETDGRVRGTNSTSNP